MQYYTAIYNIICQLKTSYYHIISIEIEKAYDKHEHPSQKKLNKIPQNNKGHTCMTGLQLTAYLYSGKTGSLFFPCKFVQRQKCLLQPNLVNIVLKNSSKSYQAG